MPIRKRLIPIEDRLSALPDSILCHILSFLPTKHSAATTVLSKRWNSLWLSVLTLDLVAKNLSDLETFQSVILLRDIKVPIQTLRLKCNVMVKAEYPRSSIINSLIMAAMKRGLETLELNMVRISNVFQCETLTVFKLRHVRVVKDPPQIKIPQLKTLHLDHVKFPTNTNVISFLLSFPTLEELQTNDVDVDKFTPETEINKRLPNLMRASISHTDAIPLFLLSRALILSINLTSTDLKPIEHTWSQQVPTFHSLTQIKLFLELDSKKKWEWMLEMLQHSPKLQHLIINNEQTENGDSDDNWQYPDVVSECFQSQLKTCLFRGCRGRKCELQFVEYVVRNSKVLRTMTILTSRSIDLKAKSQVLQLCPMSCKLKFD